MIPHDPAPDVDDNDPFVRMAREGGATIIDLHTEAGLREQARQERERKKREREEEARRRHEEAEAARRPTVYTAQQLLDLQLPPQKWLVQDLVPAGLCLLASPPKIGKTWLNLQLAIAVATGGSFAQYATTSLNRVLFLDLEGGARRERARLRKLLGGAPCPANLDVAFDWPNMNNGGLDELDAWIVERGYGLVIIDIWNKFRRRTPRGVNVYDFDSDVGHEVQTLVRKHDITVVLTHHTKKGHVEDHLDSISGSNGLPGAVDTNIVISRKRGTGNAVIQISPRDGKEHHLAVDFKDGEWTILGDAHEVYGTKRRNAIHALLAMRATWMTPKDIAEEIEDDVRAVRRILRKMRDDGVAAVDARGRYRLV